MHTLRRNCSKLKFNDERLNFNRLIKAEIVKRLFTKVGVSRLSVNVSFAIIKTIAATSTSTASGYIYIEM